MISAGDFRNGVTFEWDGKVMQVVEFQHVKPGKGAAFVRTKMRNVITGGLFERTFNPNDRVQRAHIETKSMQFSYMEGDLFYFMDSETYDMIPLNREQVEEALPYLIDNLECTVRFFKGAAFSVEPPNFITLKITECEPGVRGDTATNVTKKAKVETGYEVAVPMFVNEGDTIRIDTRTGDYMERVSV